MTATPESSAEERFLLTPEFSTGDGQAIEESPRPLLDAHSAWAEGVLAMPAYLVTGVQAG